MASFSSGALLGAIAFAKNVIAVVVCVSRGERDSLVGEKECGEVVFLLGSVSEGRSPRLDST